MILLYAFATSFCALAYQQIMAYALMDATGNFVLSQSVTLGVFLFGMGMGTLRAENDGEPGWGRLMRIEVLVGLLGIFSIGYLQSSEILWKYFAVPLKREWFLLPAIPYLFAIGYFTGNEIPCLLSVDGRAPRILALNYFGAFAASLAIPLVFLPVLDLSPTALLLGLVNLVLAAPLVRWRCVRPLVAAATLALACTAWILTAPKLRDFHLKFIYFHPEFQNLASVPSDLKILALAETPIRLRTRYQWIDVLTHDFQNQLGIESPLVVLLDRRVQFTSRSYRRYHESMVRGGAQLLGRKPAKYLILGGGDGLLAAEIARSQPEPESVDLVELDPRMLELCQSHPGIRTLNENVYTRAPWLKVHAMDGFQFVRASREKFDLIMIDLPYPVNYDLSLLYSQEFYSLVKRRLADDGVMIFDFPSVEDISERDHAILLQTLRAAGFTNPMAFGSEEMFIAAAANGKTLTLDASAFGDVDPLTKKNLQSFEKEISQLMGRPAPINSIFFPRVLAGSY